MSKNKCPVCNTHRFAAGDPTWCLTCDPPHLRKKSEETKIKKKIRSKKLSKLDKLYLKEKGYGES